MPASISQTDGVAALALQTNPGTAGGAALIFFLLYLAIIAVVVAGVWKTFTKAGQPGWAAIVPIYNVYIMLQIAGRPAWWLILLFIPIANFVVAIIVPIDIAKSFGKGTGFGLGLAFLSFIFYPLLGFGDATYEGPAAA